MNRYLIFTLLIVLSTQVFGQTATPCPDCDTIPNRHRNYFYNQWYDTCECYLNGWDCYLEITTPLTGRYVAKRFVTNEPLKIKGLTALTKVSSLYEGFFYDTIRIPEYLYLYQKVCPDDTIFYLHDSCMLLLDSVRWDSIKPHYMRFKPYRDSDIYDYCYAYDCYFNKTWTVDSVFYIMGTRNSVVRPEGNTHDWQHIPVEYASYEYEGVGCAPTDWALVKEGNGNTYTWSDFHFPNISGYYLPIVDNDSLSVLSCDTLRGSVEGSDHGYIPHGHTATIQATANPGYRFAYWSDGTTSNPKSFIIDRDTTFIAYFFHNQLENCTITVSSSNPAMGSASGGGQYLEGDTATLTATPTDSRYTFDGWSDGNTDNPRQLIVLQTASYVAQFRNPLGVQSVDDTDDGIVVAPNPTKSLFSVTCREAITELTVVNANGVTVYRARPDSPKADIDAADWAAGHYLVTVTTPSGRTTKKIVVTH